ncbi:MAG: putative porin, partial [Planctomycetes bacterium]|nr:putative porin [Planctomycetota bacterium]
MIKGQVVTVLTLAVAVMAAAPAAQAQDDVQKQIEELHKIIQYQQKEITTLKKQVEGETGGSLSQADRDRLAELVKAEVDKATSDSWFSKWTLKGDFRYRHEWINDGTLNDRRRPRVRHRVRARVGAFAKVNDEWDVGVQIATGAADPVSTNQTLDTFFSSKAVWWDLMYARYRPKQI